MKLKKKGRKEINKRVKKGENGVIDRSFQLFRGSGNGKKNCPG